MAHTRHVIFAFVKSNCFHHVAVTSNRRPLTHRVLFMISCVGQQSEPVVVFVF